MPQTVFPIWFYYGFLQHMGWPREKGFLRKTLFVDAMIADAALEQLLRIGRCLGAGDPRLGASLIDSTFSGDWTAREKVAKFDAFLVRRRWTLADSFTSNGRELPWNFVSAPEIQELVGVWFVAEIWHGLRHPGEVIAASNLVLAGGRARAEAFKAQGLAVDTGAIPESFSEAFDHAVMTIEDFESEVGVLDEAPVQLSRYIEAFRTPAQRAL